MTPAGDRLPAEERRTAAPGKMRKMPVISWLPPMDHVSRLVSFDNPSRGNFTRGTREETGDSYQREDAIDRIGSDISERPTVTIS